MLLTSVPSKAYPGDVPLLAQNGPTQISTFCASLMAHNWQKWKSTFLTCPCHKIYRVEAVGLKSSNYIRKLQFLWNVKFGEILWKFDILPITA